MRISDWSSDVCSSDLIGIILSRASALGERVAAEAFEQHVFGLTLLNDWSARDLQRWESVPLGPFTAKSFATQIGPWVIPIEALLPYGHKTETQATAADYLRHQGKWTFNRTEAHTSELQSIMRTSSAFFSLKK